MASPISNHVTRREEHMDEQSSNFHQRGQKKCFQSSQKPRLKEQLSKCHLIHVWGLEPCSEQPSISPEAEVELQTAGSPQSSVKWEAAGPTLTFVATSFHCSLSYIFESGTTSRILLLAENFSMDLESPMIMHILSILKKI